MQPVTDKTALRQTLLSTRESFAKIDNKYNNQLITRKLLGLSVVHEARAAFVYVSTTGEVETHHLIDQLTARGVVVLVPRIRDRVHMRAVRFPGWAAMEPGPLGILAPADDTTWSEPIDVAIIPGLGFTLSGERLGFGAGYYDRWLASNGKMTKIGVAFEYQITGRIPHEPHDVPMDLITTESRLIEIRDR